MGKSAGAHPVWTSCLVPWLVLALVACSTEAPAGTPPTPPWLLDVSADVDGGATDGASSPVDSGPVNLDSGGQADGAGPVATDAADDSERADGGATTDSGAMADAAPAADAAVKSAPVYYASWTRYRVQQQDPSPFGSSWAESVTTTIGLVQVIWTGDKGSSLQQTCAMAANEVHGSQVTFPATFVAALPVDPIPLTRKGKTITQPSHVTRLGLTPGYDGPLPAVGQGDHAAVIDGDKDGKPGVTVTVDIFLLGQQKLHVVQRNTRGWSADVSSNGGLDMKPDVKIQQVTVGATMDMLLAAVKEKPVSGPAEVLIWRPVAADTDCKDLVAKSSKLLGKPWPP